MSSNDATFHAKITADAKQFVAEMQGAAAALAAMVKQAEAAGGKVSSSGRSDATKAASQVKNVYETARKEADKAHAETMDNIAAEGAARKQANTSAGARSFGVSSVDYTKRKQAEGPVRDTAAVSDTLKLIAVQEESQRVTDRARLHAQDAFNETRRQTVAMNKLHAEALRDNLKFDRARRASATDTMRIQQRQLDSMVTGRYALYDQANGYDLLAQKMMVFGQALIGTVQTAAQFETAFTSVERAMQPLGDEIDSIRQSLIDLSTELPIAFADMSKIATLGAQMGVTAGGIEDFTTNVAQFSAITGASIDETASRFGRISALANIDSSDFNKLGSAVAYTGINAVATEQEILALTESIAAASTNAGFAADSTIGLATTLASLGVAPEQSRGVILRVFSDITRAADKGGEEIKAFGEVMGLSGEQAAALWKTDSSAFFKQMLDGIGTAENFTATMDKLGFTETRETNVLQRLSQNMDIYEKSMQDANKSYTEGSFLGDAYGKTADNLEAKFTILVNTLNALATSVSSGLIGPLGEAVTMLTDLTKAADGFFKSPIGQVVTPVVAGITALTVVVSSFRAISLKATAQMFAMRTSMIQMGRAGDLAAGGIKNSVQTFFGLQRAVTMTSGEIQFLTRKQYELAVADELVATKTKKAGTVVNGWAAQTRGAAIATRAFGIALNTVGVIGAVAGLATLAGTMMELNTTTMDLAGSGGGLASFRDAIYQDTTAVADGAVAYGSYQSKVYTTKTVGDSYISTLENMSGGQTKLSEDISHASTSIQEQTLYLGENSQAWLANALANDEAVQKMFKDWDASAMGAEDSLNAVGIKLEDVQKAALAKPGEGALDYVKNKMPEAYDKLYEAVNRTRGQYGPGIEGQRRLMQAMQSSSDTSVATAARMWLLADAMDGTTKAGVGTSKMMELLGVSAPTDAIEEFDDSVKDLGTSLTTVFDYLGELESLFGNIISQTYRMSEAQDGFKDGWDQTADKVKKAKKAVADLKLEVLNLKTSGKDLDNQLSIAKAYGDADEVKRIQAEIAANNQKIAETEDQITEAQKSRSMSLVGSSDAARENRAEIRARLEDAKDLVAAYATTAKANGKLPTDAEIQAYANTVAGSFSDQATAIGFSASELEQYLDTIRGFGRAAGVVERPTLDITLNPIDTAIEAYLAEKKSTKVTVNADTSKLQGQLNTAASRLQFKVNAIAQMQISVSNLKGQRDAFPKNSPMWYYFNGIYNDALKAMNSSAQGAFSTSAMFAQADGGLIRGPGTSTSDSIPGYLSDGEYVVRAAAVNHYGVDFFNSLNQMKKPMSMPMPAATTSGASGPQMVYLSTQDRELLQAAVNRPVSLYTNNRIIAQSANDGNKELARRGVTS